MTTKATTKTTKAPATKGKATTKATSKAKAPAVKAVDVDAVRPDLVDALVECASTTASAEFGVWRTLAELAELGTLSVRGFKAHLVAAQERGALFATIKASHGAALVTMLQLSRLEGAPQSVAQLFTLADNAGRVAPVIAGQTKTDTVRKTIERAQEQGKSFGDLATAVGGLKAKDPESRGARPNQGKSGAVKVLTLDTDTLDKLAKIVTAQFQAKAEFDGAMLEAMRTLAIALDVVLGSQDEF
jgi:hypothetical protein